MDFNTDPPTAAQIGGGFYLPFGASQGAFATICDANGNFLFGANNNHVFDRNYQLMKGGAMLNNTRSASGFEMWMPLIVSRGRGIYWVFYYAVNKCADGMNTPPCPGGAPNGSVNRAIIDMNRENGWGEVTNHKILVDTFSARQLAVCMNANNQDSWLVTHDALSNQFRVYPITDTGIGPAPVRSNVGRRYDQSALQLSSPFPFAGALVSSPNSELLAAQESYINMPDSLVQIYKLDRASGQVRFLFRVKIPGPSFSPSFSPDSKKLYLFGGRNDNTNAVTNSIFQLDVSVLDSAFVQNSLNVVGNSSATTAATAMLAPNGRIYGGEASSTPNTNLGEMLFPNEHGNQTQFNANWFVPLTRRGSNGLGFPVLKQTLLRNAFKLQATASKDTCCLGDIINVYGYGASATNFVWDPNPFLLSTSGAAVRATPTQSTVFRVTGWNQFDTSTASTTVQVIPKPGNPTIQWDGRDTMSVVNPQQGKYYWYRNDTLIRSTSSSVIRVEQGKTYKVKAVGAGPCLSDASNNIITNLSGLVPTESLLQVGPIPTLGILTIRPRSEWPAGTQVELLDCGGHLLVGLDLTSTSSQELDLGAFPAGIYAIRLKSQKLITRPLKVVRL